MLHCFQSNQTESQAVWIEDEVTTDYFPVNATLATQKPISQLLIVMSGVVRYKTYQIARKINDIGLSVMIPVGIVGNTLSIIVLGHRRNLHVSCSVYMVALACSDNGLLMVAAYVLYNQIVMKSRIDDVACKTSTYLIYVLTTYSTLLIVFVTLDRLIAVRFPLKAKQYCTSMSAFIKSLCLAIVAVVGNVHHIRWSKVHEGLMCAAYSYDHVIAVILSWASIVINSLLPFVIILSCNSVIIWTIRKRTSFLLALPSNKTSLPAAGTNQRQEAPSNQGARSACSSQSSTETQLTIMLLLASFVFLILTLPQYIRLMIYHLFNWYVFFLFYTVLNFYGLYIVCILIIKNISVAGIKIPKPWLIICCSFTSHTRCFSSIVRSTSGCI